MLLEISKGEFKGVDRDGTVEFVGGPQGFDVYVDGGRIHFEDEGDAIAMARDILDREGISHDRAANR